MHKPPRTRAAGQGGTSKEMSICLMLRTTGIRFKLPPLVTLAEKLPMSSRGCSHCFVLFFVFFYLFNQDSALRTERAPSPAKFDSAEREQLSVLKAVLFSLRSQRFSGACRICAAALVAAALGWRKRNIIKTKLQH